MRGNYMNEQKDKIAVIQSASFKLKDKPGRGGMLFDMKKAFGFVPDKVIVQKVTGKHDTFVLCAVKPDNAPAIIKPPGIILPGLKKR